MSGAGHARMWPLLAMVGAGLLCVCPFPDSSPRHGIAAIRPEGGATVWVKRSTGPHGELVRSRPPITHGPNGAMK